jgi:hypothetical protein
VLANKGLEGLSSCSGAQANTLRNVKNSLKSNELAVSARKIKKKKTLSSRGLTEGGKIRPYSANGKMKNCRVELQDLKLVGLWEIIKRG